MTTLTGYAAYYACWLQISLALKLHESAQFLAYFLILWQATS